MFQPMFNGFFQVHVCCMMYGTLFSHTIKALHTIILHILRCDICKIMYLLGSPCCKSQIDWPRAWERATRFPCDLMFPHYKYFDVTFVRLRTHQALLAASHKTLAKGLWKNYTLPLWLHVACPPSPPPLMELLYVNEHWGFHLDRDKAIISITRVTSNNCQSPQLRFPWLLGILWNVTQPCPTNLLLFIVRSHTHNPKWTWWCTRQSLQTKVLCVFLHIQWFKANMLNVKWLICTTVVLTSYMCVLCCLVPSPLETTFPNFHGTPMQGTVPWSLW